jgi:uncharacterized membrane protein HdeD (DUF308 family)
MKETKIKLLPGLLMLVAAILFMAGATFVARPTTIPSYVLSALGIMFLCMGTLSLLRARRPK